MAVVELNTVHEYSADPLTSQELNSRFLDSRRRHYLLVCNGVWPAFSCMFKLKAVNGYYYELSVRSV